MCYDTAPMALTCGRCGWQGEDARYCARCGADLGTAPGAPRATFPPPPPRPADAGPVFGAPRAVIATRPAGFWIRVVAVLIDNFCYFLAMGFLFAIGFVFSGTGRGRSAIPMVAYFYSWLLDACYRIGFLWYWGQTLGKMAVRIRVVSIDGAPLTFGQCVGRYFAWYLSAFILDIGFIMAGVRSDKRALHDLLAGTRVEYL